MIKENHNAYPVKMMCRLLSVSTSGFYDWRDRPLSSRSKENAEMTIKIKEIFDQEKFRAGAKRIAKRLKLNGIAIGRHRVARIMRLHGWMTRSSKMLHAS